MAYKKSSYSMPMLEEPVFLPHRKSTGQLDLQAASSSCGNYRKESLQFPKADYDSQTTHSKKELQYLLDPDKSEQEKKYKQFKSKEKFINLPDFYIGSNMRSPRLDYSPASISHVFENYNKTLKKMNEIDSKNLKLSRETYYSGYEHEILNSIRKSGQEKESENSKLLELTQNEIYKYVCEKGVLQNFVVKWGKEHLLRIFMIINASSDNFEVYVSKKQPANKRPDFIFKTSRFFIKYKDFRDMQMIYVTLLPKEKIKYELCLKFCPETNEEYEKKKSFFFEQRKFSDPGTLALQKSERARKRNFLVDNVKNSKNFTRFQNLFSNIRLAEDRFQKANFLREMNFLDMHFRKKIKQLQNEKRKEQAEKITEDNLGKLSVKITKVNWIFLLNALMFYSAIKNKIQLYKAHLAFLSRQVFYAQKIQKIYRNNVNKKINYYQRTIQSSLILVKNAITFRHLDLTNRAESLFIRFLKENKPIFTLRIKFLKLLAKIITIQIKWKEHKSSFRKKLETLKEVWNNTVIMMLGEEGKDEQQTYLLTFLDRITEKMKIELLTNYLKEKLNIFYKEMSIYLENFKKQKKSKTLALRFLNTAQKIEETFDDSARRIQFLKDQSVLLTSSLDQKIFQRDKRGKTTNIFLESNKTPNRLSFLLNRIKGERERASLLSQQESASPMQRESVDSPYFPPSEVKVDDEVKNEELTEKDLQKPIFLYLPQGDEIKEMILNALKEIAKEQEFFRTINIPKRKKK